MNAHPCLTVSTLPKFRAELARVKPALWVEIMTAEDMQRNMADLGPLLADVLDRRDALRLFTPQDVLDRCSDGRWQMWGVFRPGLIAFCVTSIDTYPLAKVLNVLLTAGRDLGEWLLELEQVHAWARGRGCTVSQVYGRRGWSRLLAPLGYTHKRDILRAAL